MDIPCLRQWTVLASYRVLVSVAKLVRERKLRSFEVPYFPKADPGQNYSISALYNYSCTYYTPDLLVMLQVLVSDGALVRVIAPARRTTDLLRSSSTARGFSGAAICASWGRYCLFMSFKSVRANHDTCVRRC
jgi:hypothetical protein